MFDMLNKGTAWKIKGLKNLCGEHVFAKSTPFLGGARLQPPKTNKVEKEIDIC